MYRLFFEGLLVLLLGGYIYIQNLAISHYKQEIKSLQNRLQQAKSEIDAKSFELKWSNAFGNAFANEIKVDNYEENSTFSSSF